MTTSTALLSLSLVGLLLPGCLASCGGVISAGAGQWGILTSPGYPSNYSIAQKCVWVVDGPSNYAIRFSFSDLSLESVGGVCRDYVEVRDGTRGATLRLQACQQSAATVVQTGGRYSWLKFYSDYARVGRGFNVTWSVVHIGNDTVGVSRGCGPTMFTCPNFECIYQGVLCDNVNDCGCSSDWCDEGDYYCRKAQIDSWVKYVAGSTLGVSVFALIFFGCVLMESRYNRCGGPCAPQSHGPDHLAEEDDSGACCECCLCLPCYREQQGIRQAREKQEEEKRELEEAYSQIMKIMVEGQRVIDWYSESRSTSNATSMVPSRQPSISSERQLPGVTYGNTLQPSDIPPVALRVTVVRPAEDGDTTA